MYKLYMRKTEKTLMKGIKELKTWRYILYPWIGRFNIVKMLVLDSKVYKEREKTQKSQHNIEDKKKV